MLKVYRIATTNIDTLVKNNEYCIIFQPKYLIPNNSKVKYMKFNSCNCLAYSYLFNWIIALRKRSEDNDINLYCEVNINRKTEEFFNLLKKYCDKDNFDKTSLTSFFSLYINNYAT